MVSKGTFHFKCFQQIKQTKTNKEKQDKRGKSFKLYNRNEIHGFFISNAFFNLASVLLNFLLN